MKVTTQIDITRAVMLIALGIILLYLAMGGHILEYFHRPAPVTGVRVVAQ